MARSFIIENNEQVEAATIPVVDNLSGIIEVNGITLMPEITYFEKKELPLFMNIKGPISLRGTTEAYSVFTNKG